MANTNAIWQQAAHTTYQLSSPSCSTRAIQKSLTLNEKYLRVFWKKSRQNGQLAEKWQDRKSKRTRQKKKNKRGDRKGESNDSPEIPDRRATPDIPGLPLGQEERKKKEEKKRRRGEQFGKMLKIFVSGELSMQVAQCISVKTTKSVASEQMFYISVQ